MKKFKILCLVMAIFLLLPMMVFAEGETNAQESTEADGVKKVNIYFFRGEGCSHCAEAEEWFESIAGEYGQYYNIVDYETWHDKDNATLLEEVASARGEEIDGVPYIIIGNKSWTGFADDYKEEMLSEIKSEYDKADSDRYDVMELYNLSVGGKKDKNYASDVIITIALLVILGGIGAGIAYARKKVSS